MKLLSRHRKAGPDNFRGAVSLSDKEQLEVDSEASSLFLLPNWVLPKPSNGKVASASLKPPKREMSPLLLASPSLLALSTGLGSRRGKEQGARLLSGEGCCTQTRHSTQRQTDGAAVSVHTPGHQEGCKATQ